jgi:response regulator RpfG family c-di-GMP phosphodiesterase
MFPIQTIDSYTNQHRLSLELRPLLVGELYLTRKLKHPVYIFKDGTFYPVIAAGTVPTKDQILILSKHQHREIYVSRSDAEEIKKNLETALIKITRSLSVGNPMENGAKDIKLVSLHLSELYKNPHKDELLMTQFQSAQNLCKFLIEHKKYQPYLFQSLLRENFHFTLVQPMLSSLLLLSYLQSIHLFHDREIENLFLASYFKDLGFSMIPSGKFDLKTLTTRDQELFANHADYSFDLLDGRIPLSKNHLTMIKHHHFMNDKIKNYLLKDHSSDQGPEIIFGLESTLVSVFDIVVAMTSDRPYRKGMSLYQSMEVIKRMMADDYPQEFKALVIFFKQFFKN